MRKKVPKYLTPEEIQPIIDVAYGIKKRDGLILDLMWQTGMRVSEVCNLHIEDINFTPGEDGLCQVLIRKGKGGKEGYVPITKEMALKTDMFRGNRKKGILFLSQRAPVPGKKKTKPRGLSTRRVQQMVKRYAGLAEIPRRVTPHMFRHSFSVNFLKKGGNIKNLQKILRHEVMAATAIYLDLTDQDTRDDYKKVMT